MPRQARVKLVVFPLLGVACSVYGSDLLRPGVDDDGGGVGEPIVRDAGADVSMGGAGGLPVTPDPGPEAGPDATAAGGTGGSGLETVEACPEAPAIDVDALGFEPCPICEDAVCVSSEVLGGSVLSLQAGFMPDCPDGEGKCIPRSYLEAGGIVLLKRCTALGLVEGRCVNRCSPQVSNQSGLRQDVCGDNELCAPCFLPTDGTPTGACSVGCDPGPSGPAFLFEHCCNSLGRCVPGSLIPDSQVDLLGPADCTATNQYCAPADLIISTNMARVCSSLAGIEGRCIPECVGLVAQQGDLLPQDVCLEGERCAPCYDPRTGLATGACTANGDQPVDPPFVFSPCCDGRGLCVPESAIPPSQLASLGTGECTGADERCVPSEFTNGSFVPSTCTSVAGAEGRCVSTCVERIQEQASFLPKDTCGDGELCAPCYDPTNGLATGSCSFNNDAPTEPPVVFSSCCSGDGKCVPSNLVPPEQQAALDAESCTGVDELCAPTDFIDPAFRPATCRSLEDAEGRCIPDCVGGVAAQAAYLPTEGCAAGEVCAPCYNPGDGSSTGACTLNGDAPTEPAFLFAECCSGTGRCVPEEVVPENFRPILAANTCSGDGASPMLCAPVTEVTGNSAVGEGPCSFQGAFGIPPGPGACYDPCTVPPLAGLPQEECDAGLACLPCFDANGLHTGACDESVQLPTADAGADAGVDSGP